MMGSMVGSVMGLATAWLASTAAGDVQADAAGDGASELWTVMPEFWLFVAAAVLSLAVAVGIAIFWIRITRQHREETQ